MALRLDHLVILVRDLDAAADDYAALGFTVTPGGIHADGLTQNALVVFGDATYLELIAFLDPDDPRDNTWGWRQFVAKGGGLIDWCMASDDLDGDVRRFSARGLSVTGPTDGGRRRPDGAELRWRSARFWQVGRELPFLIEDVTPRDLRVPGGPAATHRNGIEGIAEVVIATADVERVGAQFAALVGVDRPTIGADRRRDAMIMSIPLGDQTMTFAEPGSQHSEVQQHLETTGAGPFEIVFRAAAPQHFDYRRSQGARLRSVSRT